MICSQCEEELGWKRARCHTCGACQDCCSCADGPDTDTWNGDFGTFDRDELGVDPESTV